MPLEIEDKDAADRRVLRDRRKTGFSAIPPRKKASLRLLPTIKDSRGRESHTLLFVALAALVLTYKFAVASTTIFGITWPAMTATEFGLAFAGVLAVWLGREWQQKSKDKE